MSEFSAELIGTAFLVLLGNGVVANVVLKGTKGNNAGWIVITTGWALAVYVGVVIAGPYSTAHINPAITVGLAVAGKFAWAKVGTYIAAQLIGAIIGATIVWIIYKDHFNATADPDTKLAVFSTGPAIRNPVLNFFSEVIGTFVLMFVVFYFTDAEFGDTKTPIGLGSLGAIRVAFLVWAIGLSLGGTTGYAINPARDLGPRIAHTILPIKHKGSSNWKYAWIPVMGPLAGGALAALLYTWLKI
jgi:glycerol uptake facilitator protein